MKYLKYLLILAVLGGVLWAGITYPEVKSAFGSPTGTTFNTAKMVAVDMAPLTATATSTSVLNTDDSARWIADFGFAGCTGAGTSYTFPNTNATGLASLAVQAATTSTTGLGLMGNTNYALNMNVSTSSSIYTQSSTSTPPTQAGYWAPGTYMTFVFNATSTAACVVEMDYIPS